ncbi:septation ring formation regulator EzrA [Virgibacillus siamensis]|uniref:septation ring formation regulator EzrA n=1 Tax=Virgibacillus siamensis TaxID=480071 RepID=UPI0009850DC9|nr:septation ring formation regulator EzrA [Virgibacillus siamensis]
MAYIIGIILIIIALIIAGLILRKRIYDEVDRLEAWKMDIMNRNIASEISRIKNLNLSGETQEKFESWRERWELIVTKELPDIEEYLFDSEAAADRYRFSKAKKMLRKTEEVLQSIEDEIEKMLAELNELMESEESSRKEIEQIQPTIKALRKQLSQNRYQYGNAEEYYDSEIDGMEKQLTQYNELVGSGNYSDARHLVEELKQDLDNLQTQMEDFPALYTACKNDLPQQLNELLNGLKGMKDDGYRVEHFGFEKEIHKYQHRLKDCVSALDQGEEELAKEMKNEIEERMAEMYQLLEKEAVARNYMENKIPVYREELETLENDFLITKEEVDELQKAYYFEDSDMEKYLVLDKAIGQLKKQLHMINDEMEQEMETSHSKLRSELENGFQQVEELQKQHDDFRKQIKNLRKDEVTAKEKLADMKDDLYQINRRLSKSNIPGVPGFIWTLMEDASNKNVRVLDVLDKQPLDITEVQKALSDAESSVNQVAEQTDMVLDQAYLTEQVIQYANRYRSQYPVLSAKLSESERLFRSYEYELALEQAAKAVEEVEPGALKRIEEYQAAN